MAHDGAADAYNDAPTWKREFKKLEVEGAELRAKLKAARVRTTAFEEVAIHLRRNLDEVREQRTELIAEVAALRTLIAVYDDKGKQEQADGQDDALHG